MKTLVVTTLFKIEQGVFKFERYIEPCNKLIEGYLKYTDFDILILTNVPEVLAHVKDTRVKIVNYNENYSEPIQMKHRFNMHLKRLPIRIGSELDYDVIYHHDCDCYIEGWDQDSYNELLKWPHDVYFPTNSRPQLGLLRRSHQRFQDKIESEFGDLYREEFDNAPNCSETFVIFKNNDKLKKFLDFWDKIAERNDGQDTYHCAIYYGTSCIHAGMKFTHVTNRNKFTNYGRIDHHHRILSYYGVTYKIKE